MAEIVKIKKIVHNYDKILLITPRSKKKFVKAQAKSKGISVSAYLNILIEEDMYIH